jgi:Phosphotransferase enzyme family
MTDVDVLDPFGAASDPLLPTVASALDPREAQRQIRRLPWLAGGGAAKLRAIRVTRHKPGKRCLIEYDVDVARPGSPRVTLIGKIRHARYGKEGYRLLQSFWNAGFDSDTADGIAVPPPVGIISKFQMWVQRKVLGVSATELVAGPGGAGLARRVAEAAHKIHRAGVLAPQRHTIADEMRILHDALAMVRVAQPRLARRIDAVLAGCERLAGLAESPRAAGIHRDFYADQVIVASDRIYILDFDLYCLGDPALDAGNFIGHLTEQSLRTFGRPDALADAEQALLERFVELSGEDLRGRVEVYATLTLARHVYLSTQFIERRPFTDAILEHCEERLAARPVERGRRVRCA